MRIAKDLTQLIGHTPLMELANYSDWIGLSVPLIAKIESFNPLSSVKDRVGVALIEDGERRGLIRQGTVLIEPTSGNTGVGLAFAAAAKGYRLILTMPASMSQERRGLLKALGAELVLTDPADGMQGSVEKAEALHREILNSYIPGQFVNPANAEVHRRTTGPEILADTDGDVDIFVACIGTGGTISGVGQALKDHDQNIRVIGVEPAASPMLTKGRSGPHGIHGIGANFVPKVLDCSVLDEVVTATDQEAMETTRRLASTEGLLVGISSGAAVAAATQIALRPENRAKAIVVLLPDTGERYLSTGVFDGC